MVTLNVNASRPLHEYQPISDEPIHSKAAIVDKAYCKERLEDELCLSIRAAQDLHKPPPLDLDSTTRPPKRQLDVRAGVHQSGGRAASARSCPRRARKRQPDGTPVTPVFPRFLRTPPLQRRKASTVNHSNQDLDEDDMMSEGNSVLSILTHISRARSAPCLPTSSSSCSPSYRKPGGLAEVDSNDAVARATTAPNTLVQKHRLSAMCSNSLCSRDNASRMCAACLQRLHFNSKACVKKPLGPRCLDRSFHDPAGAALSGGAGIRCGDIECIYKERGIGQDAAGCLRAQRSSRC